MGKEKLFTSPMIKEKEEKIPKEIKQFYIDNVNKINDCVTKEEWIIGLLFDLQQKTKQQTSKDIFRKIKELGLLSMIGFKKAKRFEKLKEEYLK